MEVFISGGAPGRQNLGSALRLGLRNTRMSSRRQCYVAAAVVMVVENSYQYSVAFRCFIALILYIHMLIAGFRVLCTGVMVVATVMTVEMVMRTIKNKFESK
ncbi:hypothetical protein E2C01_002005 [Portunus trituberculatus]|uniref:Uncharacterized protein n=1 Tax=Portunus trituberculatus TaxID=210409 RepID=A0A5B7CKZ2_PORTR|nr:hypothetical protein [Portunus trituberculatus]